MSVADFYPSWCQNCQAMTWHRKKDQHCDECRLTTRGETDADFSTDNVRDFESCLDEGEHMFGTSRAWDEKDADDPTEQPLSGKQIQIAKLVANREALQEAIRQYGRMIGFLDAKIEELSK